MATRVLPLLLLPLLGCESPRPEIGSPISSGPRRLHAAGIQDPDSPAFHGALLRDNAYDLDTCRDCHGEDLTGGAAESSCIECHEDGPDDCAVCHAGVPEQGAHGVHLAGGALERPTDCQTCHVVPDTLRAPGHVVDEAGALDPPPVEVRLSGDAVAPFGPSDPTYASGTCQDVYCHGVAAPAWTDPGPLDCDGCHLDPPADHLDQEGACGRCHRPTTDRGDTIVDLSRHLDREVQLGPEDAGCAGCHGSGDDPAPPVDLAGRRALTEVTVGLHGIHLRPRLGLSAPVECSACHVVPETTTAEGHLDAAPAEVVFGGLATTDGATPTWDRQTATCSGTYCHGGGELLGADESESRRPDVVWNTPGTPQLFCGTCHGVPPTTFPHAVVEDISQCVLCHDSSVDAFGNVLEGGAHMNGRFDFDG